MATGRGSRSVNPSLFDSKWARADASQCSDFLIVPKDLPKQSELDVLGSAGVSPAVFGVPPNTRRRPAVIPLGETPSDATETVALPEITHFQSHP